MNESETPELKLQKQLVRQLKLLNFWVSTFGVLILLCIGIVGFFVFKTVMYVKDTTDKLTTVQQQATDKLDIKKQVCGGSDAFAEFVKSTGACR